jgi:V/A-type H+-transporting ATPase subunit K
MEVNMKRLVPVVVALLVLAMPVAVMAAKAETEAAAPAAESKDGAVQVGGTLNGDQRAQIASCVAIGVAFITAVSILGAAYAVAHVGSAAIGAASEKPEMMGRSLIFVALGEGLAVLGLAVAFVMMFMILMELIK